jgi:hypothetical protein
MGKRHILSKPCRSCPMHACYSQPPTLLIEMWFFVGSRLQTPYSFEWGELREIPPFTFGWASLHASAFFLLYYFLPHFCYRTFNICPINLLLS